MLKNDPAPPTCSLSPSSWMVFLSPLRIWSPRLASCMYFSWVISCITVSPAVMAGGKALKVPEKPSVGDAVSGRLDSGMLRGCIVSVVDA